MNDETIARPLSDRSTPIRVLMADPDSSVHRFYEEPLSDEDIEIVAVSSGIECVARLCERVPDVLVLEPQLPWGGGDGVLAIMGEVAQLATVPVMILTSCRDPRVFEAVARFPVSDYQLKPLAPDRLAGRLRTIIAHRKMQFTLAEQNGRLECSIARRTGGRIENLHVETVNGRIIVHGRSDSHHVKRLALAAVMEAFEASQSQSERVELDIEVAPNDEWQAERSVLSETRNEKCSDEPAFINEELALTKEN
ncbi:MAG: response regulator [Planctomycetaceae bacterium]|nr:response regulator [Planctomycetaceae bacterium]